jgi:hypothetical protein
MSGSSSANAFAPASASERSITTVVAPSRCNCFSSKRHVQKSSGRAPTLAVTRAAQSVYDPADADKPADVVRELGVGGIDDRPATDGVLDADLPERLADREQATERVAPRHPPR